MQRFLGVIFVLIVSVGSLAGSGVEEQGSEKKTVNRQKTEVAKRTVAKAVAKVIDGQCFSQAEYDAATKGTVAEGVEAAEGAKFGATPLRA